MLLASSWIPAVATAQLLDPNTNVTLQSLSPPAAGQTFIDASFGVTARRVTDRGGAGGLATAEYPQLQAVNVDETRILVSTDVDYRIVEIGSWQTTHQGLSMSLPRWSPIDPSRLWHFNRRSGGTILLQRTDLSGGGSFQTTDVVDLTNLGFTSLEYGSWEDLSEDGRYVALHGTRNGNLVAAVLDIMTGTIRSSVTITEADWVAISPSGSYFAVQYLPRGTGPTDGLVLYDAATGAFRGHATDHHEHGDLGRDHLGQEVFVTIAYTDLCAGGAVPCYSVAPLPDAIEQGTRRDLGTPMFGNYTSCRNLQRSGFCLHSDDFNAPGSAPFAGEVWIQRLSDGAPARLVHHRSSACSYYNYTRPTLSPTGRYALYTSDWANPNCNDSGDLYVIDLEPFVTNWIGGGSLPDAGVPDSGPVDAGPSPDGGPGDTGAPADANPGIDGGGEMDGGAPVDTGTDGGGGANDGSTADAGRRPSERSTSGGCACGAAGTSLGDPSWMALLLFAVRRRRR
jgi:hypothetical protein